MPKGSPEAIIRRDRICNGQKKSTNIEPQNIKRLNNTNPIKNLG